jgi:hypothetical protein
LSSRTLPRHSASKCGGEKAARTTGRRGIVLAIEGVRKASAPVAVGLVVDLELTPGTVIGAFGRDRTVDRLGGAAGPRRRRNGLRRRSAR